MNETRVCITCKHLKHKSQFYVKAQLRRQSECKECTRTRRSKWWKSAEGKRSSKNTKLKRCYGITVEQFDELVSRQSGMCRICGRHVDSAGHGLAVDHEHSTGRIRGLLCKQCNVGIGNFYDRPDLLLKAANYLIGVTK